MGGNETSTATRKAAMLAALEKSLGIVTTAANACGVSRETHRKWMQDDLEYAARVKEVKETKMDFVESMAHKRVQEGSDTMIIFMLKTQAKDRGYIERTQVEQRNVESFDSFTDEELDNELAKLEGDE